MANGAGTARTTARQQGRGRHVPDVGVLTPRILALPLSSIAGPGRLAGSVCRTPTFPCHWQTPPCCVATPRRIGACQTARRELLLPGHHPPSNPLCLLPPPSTDGRGVQPSPGAMSAPCRARWPSPLPARPPQASPATSLR